MSSLWCEKSDEVCISKLFWDKISVDQDLPPKDRSVLQKRRLGFIFLHLGLWTHWRTAQLMTLKDDEQSKRKNEQTYFDGNLFLPTTWKRLNYFVMSLLTIVLEIFFVHISFTNIFSDNLWYFIIFFKILGITVENISQILLQNNLMLIPISSTIGLMENLCTFGAPNFLEFIHSFVLGLGVQMAERAYIAPVVDMIVDFTVDKYEQLKNWIEK